MDYKDIPVADLRLDVANPRHDPAADQREAIEALLEEGGDKIVRLAEDVVRNGLSPIDEFLVLRTSPRSTAYTVLEGNRRTVVLKLLTNPDLAKARPRYQKRFKELAKSIRELPVEVRCAVVATREEANHWLALRHGGERQGVGVVPWSAEAAHRFAGRRGSQADRGLMFAEAVEKAYSNASLQADLTSVRRNRLTTLGRLISDPYVRDRLGLVLQTGEIYSHYSAKELEGAVKKIISDLANQLTVSELKTKEQRRRYIDKTIREHLPNEAKYRADARVLTRAGREAKGGTKSTPATKPAPSGPASSKPMFGDVELINLGDRVTSLLREIKRLDPGKYPNASAVLIRVLLELAVGQVFELNGWKRKQKLRDEVKYCLTRLDPTSANKKYQSIRVGLQDGTSVLAVATMQAYLHNPNFHPTATELRSIAANYSSFIRDLDSLV